MQSLNIICILSIIMIELFYHQAFPNLELNDQYVLREQSLDDTEAFFAYYSQPEVCRYILATPPASLMDAESEIYYCRQLFRAQKGIYWSIAERDTNEMIGAVGLYINNFHHRAEISYDLAPPYWRQGIMSHAINLVTEFGFQHIGLDRIEAIILEGNEASKQLLKKCSFHREGTLKNYKRYEEKPHDVEIYAKVS